MKGKLHLILSILIIIVLLSSAAICNLGQAQGSEETKSQAAEAEKKSSDTKKSSDSSSGDTIKSSTSDDGTKKDEPKSDDKKSGDENKPPIITGIYLDGLDPVDYFFFTNETYTARAEATDPEGSSLTYKWSGEGTINSGDLNPMTWTAPGTEGVYKVTVEATDDKGATSTKTTDVYVNVKAAGGNQGNNSPPVLGEILLLEKGTTTLAYPMDDWSYDLFIEVTDPDGDDLSYTWTVTVGTISNSNSNPSRWLVPKIEYQGNEYESVTITVTVDDGKGGTVTQSRTIDLYVV